MKANISIIDRLKGDPDKKFAKYFLNWKPSWHFASDYETKSLLQRLGYRNVSASLSADFVGFRDKTEFSKFVRTVILRPYLQHLPDALMRDEFAQEFEDSVSSRGKWALDYVRLTITAKN